MYSTYNDISICYNTARLVWYFNNKNNYQSNVIYTCFLFPLAVIYLCNDFLSEHVCVMFYEFTICLYSLCLHWYLQSKHFGYTNNLWKYKLNLKQKILNNRAGYSLNVYMSKAIFWLLYYIMYTTYIVITMIEASSTIVK